MPYLRGLSRHTFTWLFGLEKFLIKPEGISNFKRKLRKIENLDKFEAASYSRLWSCPLFRMKRIVKLNRKHLNVH
jgi:hypothetical protein